MNTRQERETPGGGGTGFSVSATGVNGRGAGQYSSHSGDAHAANIRDGVQEAMGGSTPSSGSVTTSRAPSQSSAAPQSVAPSTSNRGSGASHSGSRSSAPSANRYNIASWGAYHAARLATQAAVSCAT